MAVKISDDLARAALLGGLGRVQPTWTHIIVSLHTEKTSVTQSSFEAAELDTGSTGPGYSRQNFEAAESATAWRENDDDNSIENSADVEFAFTGARTALVRSYALWGGTSANDASPTFLCSVDLSDPEPNTDDDIVLHAGTIVVSLAAAA